MNVLYAKAQTHKCKFQRIPLKYGKEKGDFLIDARWKVIVNEEIEITDLKI